MRKRKEDWRRGGAGERKKMKGKEDRNKEEEGKRRLSH